MKRYLILFIAITLVSCSTEQNSSEVVDSSTTTTTTTVSTENTSSTIVDNSNDTVQDSPIEEYTYDSDKMSPFTGLELPPEIWLKRPRRVIAFKIDNNLNARPQSGLQEADSVMEILVEGGMTRFLAFYMDRSSTYVGPIRSARPTDPTLVRPYGGILVVSGATAGLILSLIHI